MNSFSSFVCLLCCFILLSSCNKSDISDTSCLAAVKKCYKLATENNEDKKSLDSALAIANAYIQCDSSKILLVELKIGILLTLARYDEGLKFIYSLSAKDFNHPYKKQYISNFLRGIKLLEAHDTIAFRIQQRRNADELERYIQSKQLSNAEFQHVFIDLYAIKKQFLDSSEVRKEIDSLMIAYPDQAYFLNFLY